MIRKTIYPRTVVSKLRIPSGTVQVPIHFRITHPFKYPPSNTTEFERWYYESFQETDVTERQYLPVFWTAYHCKNKYGKDPRAMKALQEFINSLDRSKKYYTICQYDDGPLVDFGDLDIIVCGMAGGRNDYPIPLLCQPHLYKKTHERDIFCSFTGRITHPIRSQMINQLQGKPGYYISTKEHKMEDYCNILARSKYALCPRGYSATSFRITEAIQLGAVPVYLSDEFILPYNEPFPGLLAKPEYNIYESLKETDPTNLQEIVQLTKKSYTYDGCKHKILEHLRNENL